jgi:threonine dehydratase
LKATRPLIRVVAAQPSASAAFPASLAAGRPLLSFAAGETLADGLAGGIGELVFEHRDLIDETVIVDEPDIGGAIRDLWRDQGVRAEGAAAVAVAAARTWIRRNGGRAIAIVTGGNIDDGPFTAITREPSR